MTAETLALALLAHMVGDYVIQSDKMAVAKTSSWRWALLHGFFYTLPFLVVTQSWAALAVIGGTHVVIDRFRLARHVIWAKEQVLPGGHRLPFREVRATGYQEEKLAWMAVWLMIAVDNTMHIAINLAAIVWL